MRIIRKGKLPSNVVLQCTCRNCKTVFEFEAWEAEVVNDQREGDFFRITCPLQGCSYSNTLSVPTGQSG